MHFTTALALALLAANVPPAAEAASHEQCFTSGQFEGWRAPDTKTVYIRAAVDHYYRIDLSRECVTLRWPDARLIINERAGSVICSATDIALKASDGMGGFPEPCFVKTMTMLSPDEAAALPQKLRP